MDNSTILEMNNCTKVYPGVKAMDSVSLSVKRGEIHALVGENGAGKSTLIRCLSGAAVLDGGTIEFDGKTFERMTPKHSRSLGIEVIYQELNLIDALTVAENVCFGDEYGRFVDYKLLNRKATEVFQRMEVPMDVSVQVGKLPIAQQQLVEIAKSISKDVKLLVMDEPTAPLTDDETEVLFRIIRKLKADGVTIIYISHRLDEIFNICDSVSVMRDGKMIKTLAVKDTTRRELIELMVGRTLTESFPVRSHITDEVALELRGLTGNGDSDINLSVHKGEIVGLAGLVGSGRTEILRMIFGADPREKGDVILNGRKVNIKNPTQAIAHGIGLIPEDRKSQGVLLYFGIDWNITMSVLKKNSKKGFLQFQKLKEIAEKYSGRLRVKTPSLQQKVVNLSGGNQQKVVLAKTLAADCDVILFDEPTRGIDVGAKAEIYNLMTELADEGKAILMVSSDMEELLGMSDRIYVLCEGRMNGEVMGKDATQIRLMHLMSGEKE